MVRIPHGGRRRGTPGKKYQNRTDLRGAGPLPVATAPSTGYGTRVAQEQAQQAIPLAPPSAPVAPTAPAAPPAPAGPAPGALDPLRPTERPDEPLSAGMPFGPGPGPEALAPPDPLVSGAALLNALGDKADPDTAALRAVINAHLGNAAAP